MEKGSPSSYCSSTSPTGALAFPQHDCQTQTGRPPPEPNPAQRRLLGFSAKSLCRCQDVAIPRGVSSVDGATRFDVLVQAFDEALP